MPRLHIYDEKHPQEEVEGRKRKRKTEKKKVGEVDERNKRAKYSARRVDEVAISFNARVNHNLDEASPGHSDSQCIRQRLVPSENQ